jgi:hypothetical protein
MLCYTEVRDSKEQLLTIVLQSQIILVQSLEFIGVGLESYAAHKYLRQ